MLERPPHKAPSKADFDIQAERLRSVLAGHHSWNLERLQVAIPREVGIDPFSRSVTNQILLRDSGLVNGMLLALGLTARPIELLYTPFAVITGLVYGFLPFMVLPIYASLEKQDPALLEAATMLGARPTAGFFTVTLPLARPGIMAGCFLVFIPALGSFLTSDLLGGAKQVMLGNLVQNQFMSARNWPFGSAASLVMMAGVLLGLLAWLRHRDAAPGAAP